MAKTVRSTPATQIRFIRDAWLGKQKPGLLKTAEEMNIWLTSEIAAQLAEVNEHLGSLIAGQDTGDK